jgi:ribonuclease HII
LGHVAGVDEAGIGPLAGPVVAAAVIFQPETRIPGVNDSKSLSARQRAILARRISAEALSVSIGISEVGEIDRVNVYQSGLLAMERAVLGLSAEPEVLLVDGRVVPGLSMPQKLLVKGDQRSFSIAAASIIAKTCRDQIMVDLDRQYPGYGFAAHKGYGTEAHRRALKRLGAAAPHRRSFTLIPESPGGLFDSRDPEKQEA